MGKKTSQEKDSAWFNLDMFMMEHNLQRKGVSDIFKGKGVLTIS